MRADDPAHTKTNLTAELTAERAHLDDSRKALHEMRQRAELIVDASADRVSGEALARALVRRLEQLLDDGTTPLFFGRLDFQPGDGPHAGHTFHVGRRHVADSAGDPMVVDWRAPVSEAFYRASPANPMGVGRRRRFGFAGGTLTSYEDERLVVGGAGTDSRLLTEEIERPRVGPMRDIVATIQPEQDELVRSGLDVDLCVQGAPGTGKPDPGI
jgi:DNA helicase IV